MTNPLHVGAFCAASLLLGCAVAPSRAPLGGSYALPEAAPAGDRRAQHEATPAKGTTDSQAVVKAAVPAAMPAAAAEKTLAPLTPADAIHFEPLQVGSRINAELTLTASVDMQGPVPGVSDSKIALDSRLRLELEVRQASAQSLEQLELVLTTLSSHSEFGGRSSDYKQEPATTYEIALTGPTPTIRTRNGSEVVAVERVKIALLLVPLVEFYAHWARSPTLDLKPGWTSSVALPFASTLFTTAPGEHMRAGPLDTRLAARSAGSADVPFELGLPLHYANDLGKLELDLSGSAKLDAKSGRPSAFALSGPLKATGGSRGAQLSLSGTATLACTLDYP